MSKFTDSFNKAAQRPPAKKASGQSATAPENKDEKEREFREAIEETLARKPDPNGRKEKDPSPL